MQSTTESGSGVETKDPAELRMHAYLKQLPEPVKDSPEWHAFVDALSAAGPEGCPPLFITPEGLIMSGGRRWRAARQLQWSEIPCIVRPEYEAATIIVDSLMGERSLTKGAKVYLALSLLEDFVASAEKRRLANLRKGTKTLEKPLFLPKRTECASGKGLEGLAERFGVSPRLMDQGVAVRKFFAVSHKFEFQDGSLKTLKEHFEPQLLDAEAPMGLGDVLKGIGWFVDENGNPKNQAPPERNSHLHYFQHGWQTWAQHCRRWEKMTAKERQHAITVVTESAAVVPVELLATVTDVFKAEVKRRTK